MKSFRFFILIIVSLHSCKSETKSEKKVDSAKENKTENTTPTQNGLSINPSYVINDTLKNGFYTEKYANGQVKVEGNKFNGNRIGTWFTFYENGFPWSEGNYNDQGIRHGRTASYYENGQKRYEGNYENGEKKGKWQYWDEQGNLAQEVVY